MRAGPSNKTAVIRKNIKRSIDFSAYVNGIDTHMSSIGINNMNISSELAGDVAGRLFEKVFH